MHSDGFGNRKFAQFYATFRDYYTFKHTQSTAGMGAELGPETCCYLPAIFRHSFSLFPADRAAIKISTSPETRFALTVAFPFVLASRSRLKTPELMHIVRPSLWATTGRRFKKEHTPQVGCIFFKNWFQHFLSLLCPVGASPPKKTKQVKGDGFGGL